MEFSDSDKNEDKDINQNSDQNKNNQKYLHLKNIKSF